jgi:hypothetical protein
MLISTNQPDKGKKRQSKLEKRFDKLYRQLEKQKQLNQKFQQDLDELVDTYHKHIRQSNSDQLETLVALAQKLILFASRKSLSDWHRDELCEWTRELVMERIAPVNAETAAQLQADYETSVAKALGVDLDEFHAEFEAFLNETIKNSTETDTPDEEFLDDLFGFDDFDPEFENTSEGFRDDLPPFEDPFDTPDPSAKVMDSDWIKTLFRRTAQNLHPDREADSEKRKHKQQQLSELLAARKANDVLTMIKIHNELFNNRDLKLAEQEIAAICDLLEDQLDQLNQEKMSQIYSHPIKHMVYELFYHSSKNKRQSALEEWQQELLREQTYNQELLKKLTTLKDLKSILKERRNQRDEFSSWIMEDDIF